MDSKIKEKFIVDIQEEAIKLSKKSYIDGMLETLKLLRETAKEASSNIIYLEWLDTMEREIRKWG